MRNLTAIVLAAGKGTRMKSATAKVLHQIAGVPMLHYPLNLLSSLGARRVIVVVGHAAGEVKASLGASTRVVTCTQSPQLGTGHAVMCASGQFRGGAKDDVLILSGDVPLVRVETIKALVKLHRRGGASSPAISFVSVIPGDPKGYGRVMRGDRGRVERIIEDKDLKTGRRAAREVNAGIYVVKKEFLLKKLKKLGTRNKQGEYYLPDLVSLATADGLRVSALTVVDPSEVMGINNRSELARAAAVMRGRINDSLMLSGVTIIDPHATYIDYGVKVGKDTTIYPGVHLEGATTIGKGTIIEEGVKIIDSAIGAATTVKSRSIIESSKVGRSVTIGPVARVRPGCVIGDGARVGNFVEIKKTKLGKGSKANHLSYLGDALIGSNVNIGAGTITCNYDGEKKHTTTIGDDAFIGSDSQLVAPVRIGKGAYVASGSTITRDVPAGALAVTRAEQKTIKGWAKKRIRGKKK